jgi:uncharacterized membrane protein YraQ (UPF0718 family)
MSATAVLINLLAVSALGTAFVRDRKKARAALMMAWKMFISLLPMLMVIIILIALLFAFIPRERLESFLGEQSGFLGIAAAAAAGAVLHIPALLAFPLAASLLEKGASIAVIAAFVTTLTMIGFVTLPLEIESLGRKFALLRNGLSFAAALGISFVMGFLL